MGVDTCNQNMLPRRLSSVCGSTRCGCHTTRRTAFAISFNTDDILYNNVKNKNVIEKSLILWTLFLAMLIAPFTARAEEVTIPPWETKPSNQDVRLSASVTLSCGVLTSARPGMQWSRYDATGRTVHLFVNDSSWSAPSRYRVVTHRYGYNLVIDEATREDDGVFECSVQHTTLRANARITVLVPPGEPQIAANNSGAHLVEHDYLSLNCSSSGGNPAPRVTWRRNNQILNSTRTEQPAAKYGVTSNTLVWRLAPSDHLANFSCSVTNRALVDSTVLVTTKLLHVEFQPVVSLLPFNPYRVIENDNIVLTCEIHANPTVNEQQDLFWYDNANTLVAPGRSDLRIVAVRRQHSGTYKCVAGNIVGQTEEALQLDVQYPPELRLRFTPGDVRNATVTVREHQPINMTCDVDANPLPQEGTTRWLRGRSPIHAGVSYAIRAVTRTDAGRYVCETAITMTPSGQGEMIRRATKSVDLRVQYKPGVASIQVPLSVVVGSGAELRCSVDVPGEPVAELRWTKLGSTDVLYIGSTWRLPQIALSDNGEYVCTPVNIVGDGQPDVKQLVVNEPPQWHGAPLVLRSVVRLHERAPSVVCMARGKPAPRVRWLKDGQPVDEEGWYRVVGMKSKLEQHSWNVNSTLIWKGMERSPQQTSLRIEDNGNYTCLATNSVNKKGIAQTVQLVVEYAPILNVTAHRVAIDINQSAILVCRCHSVPAPNFQWYNGSARLSAASSRVSFNDISVLEDGYPYSSELHIRSVMMTDLGNYRCVATNDIGKAEIPIHLAVKTIPEVPRNMQLVSKTWESAEFTWTAGFNGGYEQNFTIVYHITNSAERTLNYVHAGHKNRYNVTYLQPATNYTFWVFAENILGHSSYSNSLVQLTNSFLIDVPTVVIYDSLHQTLTFRSPSTHLCARVSVQDEHTWYIYEACAPTAGGSMRIEGADIQLVRVALCLERRPDVCSLAVTAKAVEEGEDLPVSVIIIVACVCGTIVLILSIILIVLCCRRYKAKKLYEQEALARASNPPVLTHTQPPPPSSIAAHKPLQPLSVNGFENAGLDRIDLDDFRSNTSDPPPAYPALGYKTRTPGIQSNNYIGSNPSNFENQQNDRNNRHQDAALDSPDGNLRRSHKDKNRPIPQREDSQPDHKDGHNESGLSGDSHRPKKIVYEVVV